MNPRAVFENQFHLVAGPRISITDHVTTSGQDELVDSASSVLQLEERRIGSGNFDRKENLAGALVNSGIAARECQANEFYPANTVKSLMPLAKVGWKAIARICIDNWQSHFLNHSPILPRVDSVKS